MCHLILALPLLALPVFWLLPLPAALLIYAVVAGFSAFVYWQAVMVMRRPVQNGAAGLIGDMGEIVGNDTDELLVRVHNELWHAVAADGALREGDRVEIVGVTGNMLHLQRLDMTRRFFAQMPGRSSAA